MLEATTSVNYSLWCFVACIPGFIWDLIQICLWFGGPKKKSAKGAKRMSFRESHPSLFKLFLVLNAVMIVALPLGFYLALHPPKVAGADGPQGGPKPPIAQPNLPPKQLLPPPSTPISGVAPKKTTPKVAGTVTQSGNANQQTVTQAPVTQSNIGGCNQQVIGGNNNTNNCAPPDRQLSPAQQSVLAGFKSQVPAELEIVVGSADSLEPHNYADKIREALGVQREVGTFFSFYGKGVFIAINSEGDTAEAPARHLGYLMQQNGINVDHVEVDKQHTHPGEILIVVGQQ